jgi:hypothetical protein
MMRTYRLIHAKAARSKIRVPLAWSWHVGLKPQDIFLASYPRSGSTWLRFMLYQILTGNDPKFQSIDCTIPEIDSHRGVRPLLPRGGRLVKTHEQCRRDYKRAVFLVRDVRDVFLSCYARSVEVGLADLVSEGDMDSFLRSFLEGRALQQGSWQQHSRSWLESPLGKNGNLMIVRYEDLRRDSERILSELLTFIGVTPNLPVIRRAIENNSLRQMREKEDKARKTGEKSALLASHRSTNEDGRFVRQGTVGGWRGKLSDAQLKLVDAYAGGMLLTLGYELGVPQERPQHAEVSAVSR